MERDVRTAASRVAPLKEVREVPQPRDETFHTAISSVLIAAQFFSLLPVQGITGANAAALRFRWLSLRMLYTCFTLCGAMLTTLFCCIQLAKIGLTFNSSLCAVFSASTLLTNLLFLQLAKQWPHLAQEWEVVERATSYYGHSHLASKFRFTTAAVMLIAFVEHVLSNISALEQSMQCSEGGLETARAFFIFHSHYVFLHVGYSHWKGVLLTIMNIIKTFSWNYMDLFLMLVSVALADRFYLLNTHLKMVKGQILPSSYWRRVREDYNMLTNLTKLVDSRISKIILLSFGSNLYFICFQLLNSMRPLHTFNESLYFYWSFVYLLLKTYAVSLCAASIHDQSQEPKSLLYSVPTESYCPEVQRFLIQVTTDEVALTGLNFFSVTRALMVTVAGTIVTYEVVLLQFNLATDLTTTVVASSYNASERCQWLQGVQY